MSHVDENPVLAAVSKRLEQQTTKGLAKYGHTVQPGELSLLEWIEHTQQELTDALVYLECIKQRLKEGSNDAVSV